MTKRIHNCDNRPYGYDPEIKLSLSKQWNLTLFADYYDDSGNLDTISLNIDIKFCPFCGINMSEANENCK